ncbi:alpha/beta hydrolase [Actinomadura rupiterrae]|uniref:alpha/beta hydrolase n=1 Tax=Actinomadura rupiterrae TaxID=559627 RepID=UPI0027E27E85|nr:alpha/beta hydrolase [Actinomadura rupiterrae]MCP2338542.1 pimeloyl-ACP methyl ester carboxylesterase [Actinomadura rupiterrae]
MPLRQAGAVITLVLAGFGLSGCKGGKDAATPSGSGRASSAEGSSAGSSMPSPSSPSGGGTAAALPASITGQRPAWAPCTGMPADAPASSGQKGAPSCAKIKVPLDYAHPGGGTVDLALLRFPATDPAHRIGSLLFNFGGPGASGTDTLGQAAGQFQNLGKRYDLVGFDPRGVGRSTAVRCLDDRALDKFTSSDSTPDDASEEKALTDEDAAYVRSCASNSGTLLPHVGTLTAARDMDVIRSVLGDAKLHYFGISYGTWLGANNAHQLPGNVGRAVLDGAVDTKISGIDLALQQSAAFQRALGNFAAYCAGLGRAQCPMGTDKNAVVASVQKLLDGLDAHPVNTQQRRPLTQSLGETGVSAALYDQTSWKILAAGLDRAAKGDGTLLLTLADLQNGRDENGHYSNLLAAYTAISCADTTERYTVQDVKRELPRFRNASPIFGPSAAWGLLSCSGWPYKGDDAAKEVSAPSAAPIVVVGNEGDPATPYAWAPALTREIGGRAVLLTLKGQGHGAYLTGDRCIVNAVDSYFLDGKVPPPNTTCT